MLIFISFIVPLIIYSCVGPSIRTWSQKIYVDNHVNCKLTWLYSTYGSAILTVYCPSFFCSFNLSDKRMSPAHVPQTTGAVPEPSEK